MHLCGYWLWVFDAYGYWKKVLDSLVLELQLFMRYPMRLLETELRSSVGTASILKN